MNAPELVLVYFLARLVVPIAVLILAGEWFARHDSSTWLKK